MANGLSATRGLVTFPRISRAIVARTEPAQTHASTQTLAVTQNYMQGKFAFGVPVTAYLQLFHAAGDRQLRECFMVYDAVGPFNATRDGVTRSAPTPKSSF